MRNYKSKRTIINRNWKIHRMKLAITSIAQMKINMMMIVDHLKAREKIDHNRLWMLQEESRRMLESKEKNKRRKKTYF